MTRSGCSTPTVPMKADIGKTRLKINVSFAAAVTLTLILDESGVSSAALLCCLVHEAGHLICLAAMGERPRLIELSFYGVKLERSGVLARRGDEALLYACGPAANLILSAVLLAVGRGGGSLRSCALISLGIGLFNLLPCVPLDGGNLLFTLLSGSLEYGRAERISFYISAAVAVPLCCLGTALLIRGGSATLLGVSAYLAASVFLNKKEKDSIKL